MKKIEYKGRTYNCEITTRDTLAMRIRVYDRNNVGNLYIWTRGFDTPKPYEHNRSKLIVKNVVLIAFRELARNNVQHVKTTAVKKETTVQTHIAGRRIRKVVADRFA